MANPVDDSDAPASRSDIERLEKVIQRLAERPAKDAWDRFAIASSFLGTVLLAGLGAWFTRSYNVGEQARQQANQAAQLRTTELQAIATLVPQLASPDAKTQGFAMLALQSIQDSEAADPKQQRAVLDIFAKVALAPTARPSDRAAATRAVAAIAAAPDSGRMVRERATEVVTAIASAQNVPAEAKAVATQAISRIRGLPLEQVQAAVEAQSCERVVDGIVLHHSGQPTASSYAGWRSVLAIARHQTEDLKWKNVGWHYAVAPDGTVWFGAPLGIDSVKIDPPRKVSVLLILDGENEKPSEAQTTSLGVLLRAVCAKTHLAPRVAFNANHGFHRDYATSTKCPGRNVTKQLVIDAMVSGQGVN